MNKNLTEMLTVEDIMEHLHIGRDKAYELIHTDTFPSIKIGRSYVVPVDEYNKWINARIGSTIIL